MIRAVGRGGFQGNSGSYMVEDEDYWENVRLVGTAITNRERKVYRTRRDCVDEEGKPEDIGLVILGPDPRLLIRRALYEKHSTILRTSQS